MYVDEASVERTIERLRRVPEQARSEVRRYIERLTDECYANVREDASLADHGLKDLAALGYPYSRRFGADSLHPDYLLHAQSGTWLSMLTHAVRDLGNKIEGRVAATAWYAFLLEYGTVKMRPRPIMAHNAEVIRKVVEDSAGDLKRSIVVAARGGR